MRRNAQLIEWGAFALMAGKQLSGWKAIAAYIGVGVRTAQEYEKSLGMPVSRQPGQKGRVFAWPDELDVWPRASLVMQGPPPELPKRSLAANEEAEAECPIGSIPESNCSGVSAETAEMPRRSTKHNAGWGVAALLLFVGAILFWLFSPLPEPAECRVSVDTLIAMDGEGREIWRYRFREGLDHEVNPWRETQS